ncbi:e3 ubiquitin-protein ligase pellino homolog 1 [Caerostris extrusa]|uniref:E3 ubiquitin-protein ligase pellino homolog 1 n=1 Tax=Caerostris extrusa TaxID=172846 RepID=A0AAV4PNU1_CAEEX|nr:e3 ubiquitin-protein ligase pellino homolog 1 [Caerostris extrusa]
MDGFTTNGVLILHPNKPWREVSVCGHIYPVRTPNIESKKRPRILDETNILQDGTLIDLCGVTLLWRTPEGLANTPSAESLYKSQALFNEMAIECRLLPKEPPKSVKERIYILLSCGHMMKLNILTDSLEGWSCPVCRCIGPIAELKIGKEPGFFL